MRPPLLVTGADARHHLNARILLGSWLVHAPQLPVLCCDFGLGAEQAAEFSRLPGVTVLRLPAHAGFTGWEAKAALGDYLEAFDPGWEVAAWIDADAFLNRPPDDWTALLAGYELLIDAHRESVAEIVLPGNLAKLRLHPDDAYFSSGFWITTSRRLLRKWKELAAIVRFEGNLWENDAFVAAVHHERIHLRAVNGSAWHARGKTSLASCTVEDGVARHAGRAIHVVHANDRYDLRPDGRRVLQRPDLAALQERYLAAYLAACPV